ncbi:MAG: hypothetical protein JXB35_00670 [Anaerolineae bacterium]|nr:hypothetical protein [Anaerolineae bacterium]
MAKRRPYYRTAALLNAQPTKTAQPLRIPWQIVALVVVIAAIALWMSMDAHWYCTDLNRIRVMGATSAETTREIIYASGIWGEHSLWLRSTDVVSRVLTSVPVATAAEATCSFYPAGCTIAVEERTPVIRWITGDGEFWVDAEGFVFPVRGDVPGLPVVRGALPQHETLIAPDWVTGVLALNALDTALGELGCHPERGLTWRDPLGRRVVFGTGMEMAQRWEAYQLLAADLAARGIAARVIDVRFLGAPTYSLVELW